MVQSSLKYQQFIFMFPYQKTPYISAKYLDINFRRGYIHAFNINSCCKNQENMLDLES